MGYEDRPLVFQPMHPDLFKSELTLQTSKKHGKSKRKCSPFVYINIYHVCKKRMHVIVYIVFRGISHHPGNFRWCPPPKRVLCTPGWGRNAKFFQLFRVFDVACPFWKNDVCTLFEKMMCVSMSSFWKDRESVRQGLCPWLLLASKNTTDRSPHLG